MKTQEFYQLFCASRTSEGITKADYGRASPLVVETHKALLSEGLLEYVPGHDQSTDNVRVRTSSEGLTKLLEHLEGYARACIEADGG